MIKEILIRVLPQQASDQTLLKEYLVEEMGLDPKTIKAIKVIKRSIDARQRMVLVNLKLQVYINELPVEQQFVPIEYPNVSSAKQVVIVGAGPAGLFAALKLIELGLKPIILERGKEVRARKVDIALITREQVVNPESNYCFGEGGAGAFSDGKLYTRSKKRGSVDEVLTLFCQHGADPSILVDAHPHIGTDRLPGVIEKMRNSILAAGGEVYFETKMERLILKEKQVVGVETSTGELFNGPVILATGHSARDVYRWLHQNGLALESKGVAVGVRIEHPQTLIDQIQYSSKEGRGSYLPAAEYNLVTQVEGRGVYSFCMCPGGFVVPAASGPEQVVVNGMSPSNRGSAWANAGMVVETHPEDITDYQEHGVLAMLEFQDEMERQSWLQGGMKQIAPAQRLVDFTQGKLASDLPESSYTPGLISSPLHFWLPTSVSKRLSEGLQQFGKMFHGFLTNEAIVIGVETRTSSPVRIPRDKNTLQHIDYKSLFPCGEGAGYAGGIVSAAIDGQRCAEAVVASFSC